MTIELHALRRLRVYTEPAGSFGVDRSGTPGDFLDIPVQSGMTWTPDQVIKDPDVVEQLIHGRQLKALGNKGGTITCPVPLHTAGLAGDDSVESGDEDDIALYRMLHTVMGGIYGGNLGSTSAAGSTTTVINVQAGHGTRFTAGGCIGWINAAGRLEMRPIKSVSTDAITVKVAFSAAPSEDDDIFNATTFYLDNSVRRSLQFLSEGRTGANRWVHRGFQLQSLAISAPFGDEMPNLNFVFQGADWENLGTAALAQADYNTDKYVGYNGGVLLAQVVGTSTLATLDTPTIEFTPNLTYLPITSPGGLNGVAGYVQAHQPPVISGSFQPYYEDQTWYNARDNRTKYLFAHQINQADGRGVMIEVPCAQITEVSGPEDAEGLSAHTVSFEGGFDEDATDQSTAIRRSPKRIHFIN